MKETVNSPSHKQPSTTLFRVFRQGQRRAASQDFREAARIFEGLIQQLPADTTNRKLQSVWEQAYVELTRCYHAMGSVASAIPYLRQAVKHRPDSESLRCMLAMSYAEGKQYSRALRALEQGLSAGLNGPMIHRCLAEIFLQQHKLDEAIAECRRSLEKDVKQESVYGILADAYLKKSDPEAAISALRGALAASPGNPEYYLRISAILRDEGHLRRAVTVLKEACQKSPRSIELREALIDCLHEARATNRVIEEAESALTMSPKNLYLLDVLAYSHLQKGNLEEAISVLQKALKVAPLDSLNRFQLATLYHQKGELRRAMGEYQWILSHESEGALLINTREAMVSIDNTQMQQVFMLASENTLFRLKLRQDVDATLREYGFHLSETTATTLHAMVGEGLFEGILPRGSSALH